MNLQKPFILVLEEEHKDISPLGVHAGLWKLGLLEEISNTGDVHPSAAGLGLMGDEKIVAFIGLQS